ncbi:hypothetical protein [Bacillus alkalicellulosilyticus]|uniref:hypothetical protein n=1 Tax=Alkalihalobacterium alkalicellulosilyticum TaxID=1912214 RepID=UPI000998E8AE|nr:hypothetical protein [Bacillus alkalicellulosilyticus]
MIELHSLLTYFENHPDYEVKPIKNNQVFNIEYVRSRQRRKNIIIELNPANGTFYVNQNGQWINGNSLKQINNNKDIMNWIHSDASFLYQRV